jgi:hypothetical protein
MAVPRIMLRCLIGFQDKITRNPVETSVNMYSNLRNLVDKLMYAAPHMRPKGLMVLQNVVRKQDIYANGVKQ